jgi:hypothetical protein
MTADGRPLFLLAIGSYWSPRIPSRGSICSLGLAFPDSMTDAVIAVFGSDRTCSVAVFGLACRIVVFKEFEGMFPAPAPSRAVMGATRS